MARAIITPPEAPAPGTTRTPNARTPNAPTPKTTATVRMYNVGFGDAFLVTVSRGDKAWRMLVDCGVVPAGKARPIGESVAAIIADLTAAAPAGSPPHLNVIVATHHHADHIAGFADDAWEKVRVDAVWVPYVEDPEDADGKALRGELAVAARRLTALVDAAALRLAADDDGGREVLAAAAIFAANSGGNDRATDRLLGRDGRTFLNTPTPRYLPSRDPAENVIATTIPGVAAHILGPSRDPAVVRLMRPPKAVQWLDEAASERPADADDRPLFDAVFEMEEADVPKDLKDAADDLELGEIGSAEELLAAASVLERSVNNTSVFFVLDVNGTRLVFVGDSQHGGWEHVLGDPARRALVTRPAFYKIGHHGSHNATPKPYVVEEVLGRGAYAMMPFGPVKRWPSIPERKLLDALEGLGTHVVRADDPSGPEVTVHPDKLWSEITFTVD